MFVASSTQLHIAIGSISLYLQNLFKLIPWESIGDILASVGTVKWLAVDRSTIQF